MFLPAANDTYNELQQYMSPQDWVTTKTRIVDWGRNHHNSRQMFDVPSITRFANHGVAATSDRNGDISRIEYGDNV